jgi:hypothetical protein
VKDSWVEEAMAQLKTFLAQRGDAPFLGEEARASAELAGLAEPADKRAWGGIFQKARRLGMIERVGYRAALSSNSSPKVLWRAIIEENSQ